MPDHRWELSSLDRQLAFTRPRPKACKQSCSATAAAAAAAHAGDRSPPVPPPALNLPLLQLYSCTEFVCNALKSCRIQPRPASRRTAQPPPRAPLPSRSRCASLFNHAADDLKRAPIGSPSPAAWARSGARSPPTCRRHRLSPATHSGPSHPNHSSPCRLPTLMWR